MICKIRLGILFILTCCVTSCAVIKDTQQPVLNKIDNQTFSKLNGKFSNNPTQSEASSYNDLVFPTYGPVPFYSQIEDNNPVGSETDWKKQSIRIEFISSRKGYVSSPIKATCFGQAFATIRGLKSMGRYINASNIVWGLISMAAGVLHFSAGSPVF